MVHFDPAWFEAAGTSIVAAETGVAMWSNSKKKAAEPAVTAPAVAPAAPAPVYVTINGMTGQDWKNGILIMAGVVLLLATAMLVSAAIIHHGLIF